MSRRSNKTAKRLAGIRRDSLDLGSVWVKKTTESDRREAELKRSLERLENLDRREGWIIRAREQARKNREKRENPT